jgi:hypothetical protein
MYLPLIDGILGLAGAGGTQTRIIHLKGLYSNQKLDSKSTLSANA